jgi:hypothetical protein
MRSKFLQQVLGNTAIKCQTGSLTSGAKEVKGEMIDRASSSVGFFRSALFTIFGGISGSNNITWTLKFQHSDDTTDGNFTDITLATGQTLPTVAVTTAAAAYRAIFLKLSGLKRYVRIVATAAGTTTDTFSIAGSVVLGDGTPEWFPRGSEPVVFVKAA